MKRIFWVIENTLAGRAGPTWEPWSLGELRAGGFETVLNLSEHAPEPADFRSAGLRVHWIPMPTTVPPDEDTTASCRAALIRAHALLLEELAQGRRVLVHCVAGCDRTGSLLTLHLARTERLTAREALDRVRLVRPGAIAARGWEPMALRLVDDLCAPVAL